MATKFREALYEAINAVKARGYFPGNDLVIVYMNAQMNAYLLHEAGFPSEEPAGFIFSHTIIEEDTGHAAVVRSHDGLVEAQVDWEPQPAVGLRNAQFYTGGTLVAWNLETSSTLTSALRHSLTTPIFRQVQPEDPDVTQAREWWADRWSEEVRATIEQRRVRPEPPRFEWPQSSLDDEIVDLRQHFARILQQSVDDTILNNPPRPLENLTLRLGDHEVPVVIDPEHPNTLTIVSGHRMGEIWTTNSNIELTTDDRDGGEDDTTTSDTPSD